MQHKIKGWNRNIHFLHLKLNIEIETMEVTVTWSLLLKQINQTIISVFQETYKTEDRKSST